MKKKILKKLKDLKKLFYKKFFGTKKVATVIRRRNTITVVTRSIKIGDKIITSEPEFRFNFNKSLSQYGNGTIDVNEVDYMVTVDDKPTMININ